MCSALESHFTQFVGNLYVRSSLPLHNVQANCQQSNEMFSIDFVLKMGFIENVEKIIFHLTIKEN